MNLTRPKMLAVLAVLLVDGFFAGAQPTNSSAGTDYSSFRVIADRNIFNPDRYPRTSRNGRRQRSKAAPASPTFSLVGTMNYQKGTFAFFDGNSPEYQKVLERNGVVAGYTVKEITQTGVKLEAAGKQVEMKLGAQMRQNDEKGWELAVTGEQSASTDVGASPASGSAETPSASAESVGDGNDILKRLMQKREQELK